MPAGGVLGDVFIPLGPWPTSTLRLILIIFLSVYLTLPTFIHSHRSFTVMPVIDKTNSLQVTGDIAYLTVNGILPPDPTQLYYRFDLDVTTPGRKVRPLSYDILQCSLISWIDDRVPHFEFATRATTFDPIHSSFGFIPRNRKLSQQR
jgi:hypothetical protein